MPTSSLSSTTQSIGNPGYLVLSYAGGTGGTDVAVSFIPTLARMVNPQYAPLQKINVAVNGSVHVWQYGANLEPLYFPLEFTDLPWSQDVFSATGRHTAGYADLLSFLRYTLNYHEKTCTLLTPDGQLDEVRYMNGIESFREAAGATNKQQFWTGQILFWRVID